LLRKHEHSVTCAGVAGVVALGIYLCGDALFARLTGYANSMHGFWMALAKAPLLDWLRPTWWPWWDCGMPMEYTYAPLVPWITGAIARASGLATSHAWQIVTVAVFVLGPAAVFWSARRLGASTAFALAGALFYSLTAPAELFAPEAEFAWSRFWSPRRMYLAFVWDETPHLAALALVLPAVVSWARYLESPTAARRTLAALATALPALANTFGATGLAIAFVCLLAARPAEWRAIAARMIPVAALAYALASPWLPPSLIAAMVRNSAAYPEGAVAGESAMAAAALAAAMIPAAWLLSRATGDWALRFWALMVIANCGVVAMFYHLGWRAAPQAGRYRAEAEVALAMCVAFVTPAVARRLPRIALAIVAAALVYAVWSQAVSHRRFALGVVRRVEASSMVESQVARKLESMRLPRVFAPGSIASWMNAFAPVAQVGGGSFPTALNPAQQAAVETIYGRGAGDPVAALRAFGAGAVVVSLPAGREFWKPYPRPDMYDGKLPLLWSDADVRVYDTGVRSLASSGVFRWIGSNRAVIEGAASGAPIAVSVNYHPGWRASSGGRSLAIRRDANGLMAIERAGDQPIELHFTGDAEAWLARLAAASVLLWLLVSLARGAGRGYPSAETSSGNTA
jgi:hypothetical protein